jgi:hypothetical protein
LYLLDRRSLEPLDAGYRSLDFCLSAALASMKSRSKKIRRAEVAIEQGLQGLLTESDPKRRITGGARLHGLPKIFRSWDWLVSHWPPTLPD